ncbi:hypothetical protein HYPSUDRAFT_33382 [Hypholoma sublateritium FD-334 SS-4]|uniref:FAD dependent oxidoreductase domain-containing protein n=1 Tax=Hypholoma sublateritium (strain FD-334 SS-4) TaxID=945553 RepID=A0A0D2PKK6_HYPSF|nr:hypothetical protein HYPSUDRAFT_33382 [Hypholoma sublateritium FD-334 SS-4]
MIPPTKDESILIIGAGCFGVSTAYHLLRRGYTGVTVIDRAASVPAPDAASNDINRIVRTSYADKFYSELARAAIASWKDEKWGDTYHESGVLVLGASAAGGASSYADEAYENDRALGASVQEFADGAALRAAFPAQVHTAQFEECAGYLNRDGGWANAGQGLALLIDEVQTLGGTIIPGKNVSKIIRAPASGRSIGVQCDDGTVFNASLIVLATGSWTPYAFREQLDLGRMCLATGQCIATIQLSAEEGDIYRACPVVLDFKSGFYVFPPNKDNILKLAIHAAGYTYFGEGNSTISTPRTITTDPSRGLHIPKAALQELRANLKNVYPDLAEKTFLGTRLCWYNDSPDSDWVISRYPKDDSLILATAGSGHAYKFLPVIGGLIADLVEDKLSAQLTAKFSIERKITQVDTSRSGEVQALDLTELNTPEDLQFRPIS